MKKYLYLLLSILLLVSLTATSQIKRGKKSTHTQPKTEQLSSSSEKTSKTKNKQNKSDRSNGMTQAERDRIIQRAINDMVYVEGGTFMMGATSEQESCLFANAYKPVHKVTLSSFYISKYEVTQELWIAVMGKNPSKFKRDLKNPVEKVSWLDCQSFISKLNLLSGKQFRLPTEAEWEYAARGGNRSKAYKFSGSDDLSTVAWYKDTYGLSTRPVGTKSPNELGLYDMSGNVEEWCQDWLSEYDNMDQSNPTGPSSGSFRVFRGGGWHFRDVDCYLSRRAGVSPEVKSDDIGMRLALSE